MSDEMSLGEAYGAFLECLVEKRDQVVCKFVEERVDRGGGDLALAGIEFLTAHQQVEAAREVLASMTERDRASPAITLENISGG